MAVRDLRPIFLFPVNLHTHACLDLPFHISIIELPLALVRTNRAAFNCGHECVVETFFALVRLTDK